MATKLDFTIPTAETVKVSVKISAPHSERLNHIKSFLASKNPTIKSITDTNAIEMAIDALYSVNEIKSFSLSTTTKDKK